MYTAALHVILLGEAFSQRTEFTVKMFIYLSYLWTNTTVSSGFCMMKTVTARVLGVGKGRRKYKGHTQDAICLSVQVSVIFVSEQQIQRIRVSLWSFLQDSETIRGKDPTKCLRWIHQGITLIE